MSEKLIAFVAMTALAASVSQASPPKRNVVECGSKKSPTLQAVIDRLEKTESNIVYILGACTETVKIQGHRDLSLIASGTASITAGAPADAVIAIRDSRVLIRGIGVSAGKQAFHGVSCDDHSFCSLENVSSRDALEAGVFIQQQSSANISGDSRVSISGNTTGIGVYGQSSANIIPAVFDQPGLTISNNSFAGITVLDGSFLRIENASITANQGSGIFADRGTVLKVLGTSITNNAAEGLYVRNSTLQLSPQFGLPAAVSGNLGSGISLRSLSFAAFSGTVSGNGGAFPDGVDCKPGAALRVSAAIRGASSPNCGVE